MERYLQFAWNQRTDREPETLVLMLDTSGSMDSDDYHPTRLGAAAEAGCALVDLKARRFPEDLVGIVSFSSSARVLHAPVRVGEGAASLRSALHALTSTGSTNIHAGLTAATKLLQRKVESEAEGRDLLGKVKRWAFGLMDPPDTGEDRTPHARRILGLTDGHHNAVRDPLKAAHAAKTRCGIVIEMIGIAGAPEDVDPRAAQIASLGEGGKPRYTWIGSTEGLIREFQERACHIKPLTTDPAVTDRP